MKRVDIQGVGLDAELRVPVEVEKRGVGCVRMEVEVGMIVEVEKNEVQCPRSDGKSPCMRSGGSLSATGQMARTSACGPCRRGIAWTMDFVRSVLLLMAKQ